jgi:hypothetical protein
MVLASGELLLIGVFQERLYIIDSLVYNLEKMHLKAVRGFLRSRKAIWLNGFILK